MTVEPLNFPLLVYNSITCSQTLHFLFRDRRCAFEKKNCGGLLTASARECFAIAPRSLSLTRFSRALAKFIEKNIKKCGQAINTAITEEPLRRNSSLKCS